MCAKLQLYPPIIIDRLDKRDKVMLDIVQVLRLARLPRGRGGGVGLFEEIGLVE
jgi:hypothetical protein